MKKPKLYQPARQRMTVFSWIIILLLWPISGFAMVLTGLWLPAVLTMQAIYPVLNKAFDLERQIKAIRDAELDSSSDSDN